MNFTTGKTAILAILILIVAIITYDYLSHTYIKVEFAKTDPMPAKMGVYYKGYRLGNTTKLNIAKDFSKTYLYITLNQRGLHLPNNITAEVKYYDDDTKFVDLIYPDAPSIKFIKSGDIIEGKSDLHGADGISNTNQAHLDNLSEKGEGLLSSAKETTDTLTGLLLLINDILSENRENLHSSTCALKNSMANLESTTENFKNLSKKIDTEVTSTNLKNTLSNIETTTKNLSAGTRNFIKLNELLDLGKSTLCKLNDILNGLGETLRKHAGGMRVLFGVPVKE